MRIISLKEESCYDSGPYCIMITTHMPLTNRETIQQPKTADWRSIAPSVHHSDTLLCTACNPLSGPGDTPG